MKIENIKLYYTRPESISFVCILIIYASCRPKKNQYFKHMEFNYSTYTRNTKHFIIVTTESNLLVLSPIGGKKHS